MDTTGDTTCTQEEVTQNTDYYDRIFWPIIGVTLVDNRGRLIYDCLCYSKLLQVKVYKL